MFELNDFPPELLLTILQYLPLQSLRAMTLLSRGWRNFFAQHKSVIYKNAAIFHRFVSHYNVSLGDAREAHDSMLSNNIDDWYTFCNHLFTLHKNWCGDTSKINIKVFNSPGSSMHVHRLKVDGRNGFVITTHDMGGLKVIDSTTEATLWELPPTYVRTHAHCEYQNGFLIFDRFGAAKEVWRHYPDYDDSAARLVVQRPDDDQRGTGARSMESITSDDKRGCFKPWALLEMSQLGGAYRFVYPTLVVASMSTAYLYNVMEGKLIQTIEFTPNADDWVVGINYVEVNDKYVFVCCPDYLRIYSRSNGENVLCIKSTTISSIRYFDVKESRLELDGRLRQKHLAALVDFELDPVFTPTDPVFEFTAVHVCGSNLAVILSDERLVVIRDYESIITNPQSLSDLALQFGIVDPGGFASSRYLAFEYGRIGVVMTSGVFVFTVDSTEHELLHPDGERIASVNLSPSLRDTPFPNLIGCQIMPFFDIRFLDEVSCLQMTANKLYATFNPEILRIRDLMLSQFRDYANDLASGESGIEDDVDFYWTKGVTFAARTGAFDKCVVSVDFS